MKSAEILKTVLITGATSGIGRATALELAQMNYQIVFMARNADKAEALKAGIRNVSGRDPFFIQVDLASLDQVRRGAFIFKERYPMLDVLINNAGIILSSKEITADGLEKTFQVNHLSHFLLTNLLLNELRNAPGARIINVSSGLYKWGVFDPSNLQGEKSFSPRQAYNNTKLMNILFTIELADRLKDTGITVNVLHPGIVKTNFGKKQKGLTRMLIKLFSPFLLSPQEGAKTSVYLASSEDVENITGKYFEKSKIVELKNDFITRENMQTLWEKSMLLAELYDESQGY